MQILCEIKAETMSNFHEKQKIQLYFRNRREILGVTIPESVNKLLEELIEQLIDNYINSWYKAKISGDLAFVNEIR